MTDIDEYAAGFREEPGYLDFASVGPVGAAVVAEQAAFTEILSHGRFGTRQALEDQDARVTAAIALTTGFPESHVVFQPSTTEGVMHAMFGLTGGVALSQAEYPALTFGATRAAEALGVVTPVWLEPDHGRLTPGTIREQLEAASGAVAAVAISLVDFRTGYLADLEGIRQVIGDRLLIVDAIQGFGVVDAPYGVADVLVTGGQKWVRAGWGTGLLALSERALDHLTPVWSGLTGSDIGDDVPLDEVLPVARGPRAFTVTRPDRVAQARLAVALEGIADVGVAAIRSRLAEQVGRVIELADEYAIPVVSPRDEHDRAGIVVLEPDADQLTVLTAALHNHGVTVTQRQGRIRISPHVSTSEETFGMLRAAFLSFATATPV